MLRRAADRAGLAGVEAHGEVRGLVQRRQVACLIEAALRESEHLLLRVGDAPRLRRLLGRGLDGCFGDLEILRVPGDLLCDPRRFAPGLQQPRESREASLLRCRALRAQGRGSCRSVGPHQRGFSRVQRRLCVGQFPLGLGRRFGCLHMLLGFRSRERRRLGFGVSLVGVFQHRTRLVALHHRFLVLAKRVGERRLCKEQRRLGGARGLLWAVETSGTQRCVLARPSCCLPGLGLLQQGPRVLRGIALGEPLGFVNGGGEAHAGSCGGTLRPPGRLLQPLRALSGGLRRPPRVRGIRGLRLTEQRPHALAQARLLLPRRLVHPLQLGLDAAVQLRREQRAEDLLPVARPRGQQFAEAPLREHDHLPELAGAEPDQFPYPSVDLADLLAAQRGLAVGPDLAQRCLVLALHEPTFSRRLLGGFARDAKAPRAKGEVEHHLRLDFGGRVVAPQVVAFALIATALAEQRETHGIEQRRLASAGGPVDEEQAVFAEAGQIEHLLARVGAEGAQHETLRPHRAAPSTAARAMAPCAPSQSGSPSARQNSCMTISGSAALPRCPAGAASGRGAASA